VPDPTIIDPTDIVARIDCSTICGTDCKVGASVVTVEVVDRVLLSCVSACGRCRFCKDGRNGQCLGGGGWIFGHTSRPASSFCGPAPGWNRGTGA